MQKLIIFLIIFFSFGNLFSKEEYFLTLRNEKVNLRQGPSFDYPVKIFYKKKYLPVLIQDSSDNFRKIRDHENNSGWIHIKNRTLKNIKNVDDNFENYLFKKNLKIMAFKNYFYYLPIDNINDLKNANLDWIKNNKTWFSFL